MTRKNKKETPGLSSARPEVNDQLPGIHVINRDDIEQHFGPSELTQTSKESAGSDKNKVTERLSSESINAKPSKPRPKR